MRHAILLLWHTDAKQLLDLTECFDEDFTFYIHIDKRSKEDIGRLKQKNNIHIYRKYKIHWGGFNILKAELFLLRKIVEDKKDYAYIHFFSGQDYPIKNLQYIKDFFIANIGKEFMHYMKIPSKHWEKGTYDRYLYYRFHDLFDYRKRQGAHIGSLIVNFQIKHRIKRLIPNQVPQLYGGSNWMSITAACAKHIVTNEKNNKPLYNRLKYTFAPEETYFQSVILNSRFKENVENWNLRYIVWEGKASPRTLSTKDWPDIQRCKELFARKIDRSRSKHLISLINNYLKANQSTKFALKEEVILLVAHKVNPSLIHKYWQIKEQVSEADIILLLEEDESDNFDINLPDGIDYRIFNVDMLNALSYDPVEETIVPGSNHFITLWFFLTNRHYKNYWSIEYDVDFTGNWNTLFESFRKETADFISTHLQTYKERPDWYWWDSYHGITLNITLHERIRSFNPIYRISAEALEFLDKFLKKGNSGHHEVLIPTALYHSGFKILDFGGCGSFVLPQYKEKFYLDSTILTDGLQGTMRHKPNFKTILSYNLPDKLFHPVKE